MPQSIGPQTPPSEPQEPHHPKKKKKVTFGLEREVFVFDKRSKDVFDKRVESAKLPSEEASVSPLSNTATKTEKVSQGVFAKIYAFFQSVGKALQRMPSTVSFELRWLGYTLTDTFLHRAKRRRELASLESGLSSSSAKLIEHLNGHNPRGLTKSAQFAYLKAYKKYERAKLASSRGGAFSISLAGLLLRAHIALLEYEVGEFRDLHSTLSRGKERNERIVSKLRKDDSTYAARLDALYEMVSRNWSLQPTERQREDQEKVIKLLPKGMQDDFERYLIQEGRREGADQEGVRHFVLRMKGG